MICETLFGLATTVAMQIAYAPEYQKVIEVVVDKSYLNEARYYVNSNIPGFAGFIENEKLYVVRMDAR